MILKKDLSNLKRQKILSKKKMQVMRKEEFHFTF